MRIDKINNINYNFKGNTTSRKLGGKLKAGVVATFSALAGLGYLKNKEAWDTFIKEEKQERIDNLKIKPEIKKFDTHEAAVNYAFDRILPWINAENPREYSVKIDNKTHNILTEFRGLENSVTTRKSIKMLAKQEFDKNYTYTSIHGHPGQELGGTTTFSYIDLETFLKDDFCTEDYVLSRERKYCRMKKEENYRKPNEQEMNRILEDYTRMCKIAVAWQKTIKDEDGNILFEFIDYPALHSALARYLEPFGISYTTTYGTYGEINDIYENGYHEGFNNGGKLLSSHPIKMPD